MNEFATIIAQLGIFGVGLYLAFKIYGDAKEDRNQHREDLKQYHDDLKLRDEKFEKVVEKYAVDKQESTKADIELKEKLGDLVGRIDNILRT